MTSKLNLLIYPSTLEGASRIEKLANSLQQSSLEFSETHAVGIHRAGLNEVEEIAPGVKLVRIAGSTRRGTLGNVLKLIQWRPRVYKFYKDKPLASVAAHNVWLLPLAYRLSKKTGAVLVYNAHELETETIAGKGLKQWVTKYIERRYIKQVKVVSVVNESIADWYENHYPITRPISVTNIPLDDGTSVNLRAELGITDDNLLFIHTGHLTYGRNIPLILQKFAENGKAHVVFLGDGPLRQDVVAASTTSLNIHWISPVPPHSVVGYARGADAGLNLIEYVSLSDKLSTSNKLFEALAAGIPSLSSDLPEARRFLGENADDWILESPKDELGEFLIRVDAELIAKFKKTLRSLPSWEDQVAPLIEAYRSALASSNNRQ